MTPTSTPLLDTSLDGLTLHRRGKVRDVYEIGDQLLIVTTDRISAFDYVLGSGIPDKGKVLTQLSGFWFERMGDLVPHHLCRWTSAMFPAAARAHADVAARPDDAGAAHGAGADRVRGARLPVGIGLEGIPADRPRLRHRAARRPAASPTGCPSRSSRPPRRPRAATTRTSARRRPARLVGETAREAAQGADARNLPARRRARGESKGIIIADTKFEFGLVGAGDPDTDVVLIDEVLTPDSSRFWPQAQYEPGHGQPSFDKQFVRDYLEEIRWNKQPPVPSLPDEVVQPDARQVRRGVHACCRAASCSSARARSTRPAHPGDARQGHALRRRAPRVREDVHHPRAAALEGQRRRRRRRCSASTATPSRGRWPSTGSSGR